MVTFFIGCDTGEPYTLIKQKNENPKVQPKINSTKLVRAPFYDQTDNIPDIEAPEGFEWKQFDGMTLNFLIENNIYANVLSKESEQFTKITGITINIHPMDFSTMVDKLNLDFISGTDKYQVIYADPYQTLNRFSNNLEDLNQFNNDPYLPHIPGGTGDFLKNLFEVDSYFLNDKKLCTIPCDSTTMILFYRKDIFEKYKNQFMSEKGYDWTPGEKNFTWERYCEISQWISMNVPKNEVKSGSGHMAKMHNSLFCDFSNVMASYGADYFSDNNAGSLGLTIGENLRIGEPDFIKALAMYKKVIKSAAPESMSWEWSDLVEVFKSGSIAMMPNWNENSSSIENIEKSKVAGKVGYSILPYGPVKSANIFGGTGIGINNDASDKEKKAAWLFVIWATSPQTELLVLKHPEGGDIPSRKSAYNDADVKEMLLKNTSENAKYKTLLPLPTVLKAWDKENAYYRPKLGKSYQFEGIIVNELYKMLKDNKSEVETAKAMAEQIKNIKN